ncbi:three-helix bundle dimerization domain-containing protein [Nocardia sp. NPDC006630]|uniref:three-helix bundle dimerization domain-containing protein n=1 Tax=Nocardia sp. NPDC006630 TaxID=3157181 RepID=UPI0033B937CA
MRNDENSQIQVTLERLAERHPEVSPTVMAAIVAHARDSFADARIRVFIPLPIERRANIELAAASRN